ncbi:MAG: hypothetical protein OXE92_08905 [Bacteroidetes bacterium]|nr:hypothetical protein [Bacteroidota bacterium]
MIAFGEDPLLALCYIVREGYRISTSYVLGNLIRFNAVNMSVFETEIELRDEEIERKFGPILNSDEVQKVNDGMSVEKILELRSL